ncbi:hypothetical protein [Methylobacterium oryzihabitans]|uniref:Uncharacterized protein n=1 Tax=Methylobacterium oryzihabitans TaxID=2499852 RepID=A0A3S2YVE5_9HYPH|nr:hypothetical protein [Methylobacterium oryzihabitans]RVU20118.1 hypothetical protein EOE48_05765 [Methylobacterium oryzihabitans]
MPNPVYAAIEKKSDVCAAMKEWQRKFEEGSDRLPGMQGSIDWHPSLKLWGSFGGWRKGNGAFRYWNAFGMERPNFRQNIIVEINPPDQGSNKIMQGVLALDARQSRWILHKGRLSIPGKGISENEFDLAVSSRRVPVRFSDGTVVECHPVAEIDNSPSAVQRQVAEFVAKCLIVRSFYQFGEKIHEQALNVEDAERSVPELTGFYEIGPQAGRQVERKHGEVWRALVEELDRRNIKHTNGRVGRWGPDLRTIEVDPILFEIKVAISAHDLQCAVGQLLLYEGLLGKSYRKVMVVPWDSGLENSSYIRQIRDLDIMILPYRTRKMGVYFPEKEMLHELLRSGIDDPIS